MNAVLVTGGAGFIGSHYVKAPLRADDTARVTVLDALTYAGHVDNLGEAFLDPRLTLCLVCPGSRVKAPCISA